MTSRARHKRISKNRKKFQMAAAVAAIPVVLASASPAIAQPSTAWDVVIDCESGHQNIENAGPSTASGYFQIIDSTWASAGGTEFAPRAIDATFEQQAIVAQRIAERRGSLGDWDASRGCWGSKITSELPDAAAGAIQVALSTPAPAPVPTATAYTVVQGDTLFHIGQVLGIDWRELARLNNIGEPYTIAVGQVLNLPVTEYTVVPGDTLSEIATVEFDLPSWEPLYEANKNVIGADPNHIVPGQVFFVRGLPIGQAPVTIEEPTVEASSYGVVSPCPGATLSSGYGPRGNEFHNGIDLAAPVGTPIFAAVAGQVIANGEAQGFGWWIRIKDLDGIVHTYGHMYGNTSTVLEGQWVEAGTKIAEVGSNGISTGPHLHYRVEDGEGAGALPINPQTWLADHGVNV